jgi:hypothetical protein
MKKDVNGVVTEIDTVIHLDNMEDAKEALIGLGMDADIDIDGDAKGVKMMRIEIETDEEHDGDVKTWIHEGDKDLEGAEVKVIELEDGGNLREMLENLEGMSEEEKAEMMKAFEGVDAKGEHKKIKVIRLEDKDVDIRVDGEDGEGHRVIMFKGDKDDINLDDIDVDDIMTVDVRKMKEGEGDDVRVVKEVRITIRLTDLDDSDKAALKRAGAPVENDISRSLQLDNLAFYPNPNDGRFRLRFNAPDAGDVSIRIVNMEGQELHREDLRGFSGSYDEVISIEDQASGTYLLSISQNGKIVNKKLVKQ